MRAKLQIIRAKLGVLKIAWEAWRFRRGDDKSIARRQQARLDDIVRHARTVSPYYRNLYRHLELGPVTLASLPVVTKRDLMAHFDEWVTDPAISLESLRRDFLANPSLLGARYLGRYHVATTSGTSGDPAILIHDDASWALVHFVGGRGELRFIARWDLLPRVLRRGLRVAALFVTDAHDGAAAAMESARRRSPVLAKRIRTFSVLRPLTELVTEINVFQPTVSCGLPKRVGTAGERTTGGSAQDSAATGHHCERASDAGISRRHRVDVRLPGREPLWLSRISWLSNGMRAWAVPRQQ